MEAISEVKIFAAKKEMGKAATGIFASVCLIWLSIGLSKPSSFQEVSCCRFWSKPATHSG